MATCCERAALDLQRAALGGQVRSWPDWPSFQTLTGDILPDRDACTIADLSITTILGGGAGAARTGVPRIARPAQASARLEGSFVVVSILVAVLKWMDLGSVCIRGVPEIGGPVIDLDRTDRRLPIYTDAGGRRGRRDFLAFSHGADAGRLRAGAGARVRGEHFRIGFDVRPGARRTDRMGLACRTCLFRLPANGSSTTTCWPNSRR